MIRKPVRYLVEDRGHETPCWIWQLSRLDNGYGVDSVNRKTFLAHRLSYERLVGPIPEGLDLDHLCRVRECVNPSHLEPVTRAENLRRGQAARTHCLHGHPWNAENTHVDSRGRRECRACRQEWTRKRNEARRRGRKTKITDEQVEEIRVSTDRGVDLARRYGISPQQVCNIRKGRSRLVAISMVGGRRAA